MWMLAMLGMIGAALAANRREQRGPSPVQDELAAAREAGTFMELRESLWEEGAAVLEEQLVATGMPADPVTGYSPLYPYPVLNTTDVVTSADRASVRMMAARGRLLDTAHGEGAAWV